MPDFRVRPDDVHVWQVSLESSPDLVPRLVQMLAADEQARAKRFHFERDRVAFIAARVALRMILGRYLALDPAHLTFTYGPHGKPFLGGETDLAFNISHSARLALVGLALGRPIGIDVEQVRPLGDVQDLPPTIFSSRELAEFQSLRPAEHQMAFFAAWTRKEALVKAVGRGFSMPVEEVEVTFAPGAPADLVRLHGETHAAAQWTLRDVRTPPGFRGALATPGVVGRVVHQNWHAGSH